MSLSHASSNDSILTTKKIFEQLSVSTKSIYKQTQQEAFANLEIELHQIKYVNTGLNTGQVAV